MGMSPEVTIWVGIRLQEEDLDWYDDILPKLPESIKDEDGESLNWDEDVIKAALNGILVDYVNCSEECIGFGVVIFSHDWNYGTKVFNIAEIAQKEQEALAVIQPLFEEWGIQGQVGTYIQTDYS